MDELEFIIVLCRCLPKFICLEVLIRIMVLNNTYKTLKMCRATQNIYCKFENNDVDMVVRKIAKRCNNYMRMKVGWTPPELETRNSPQIFSETQVLQFTKCRGLY